MNDNERRATVRLREIISNLNKENSSQEKEIAKLKTKLSQEKNLLAYYKQDVKKLKEELALKDKENLVLNKALELLAKKLQDLTFCPDGSGIFKIKCEHNCIECIKKFYIEQARGKK